MRFRITWKPVPGAKALSRWFVIVRAKARTYLRSNGVGGGIGNGQEKKQIPGGNDRKKGNGNGNGKGNGRNSRDGGN
jgi:hypothetical protein